MRADLADAVVQRDVEIDDQRFLGQIRIVAGDVVEERGGGAVEA